jgi:hypothetical protein
LKKLSPPAAKDYERQYALLLTMLVILSLVLLSATMYGMMQDFPDKFKSWFGKSSIVHQLQNDETFRFRA